MSAPANDNYASALTVSGQIGSATGTTAGSIQETGEGLFTYVWYQYTAPFNGVYQFDTLSSTPTTQNTYLVCRDGADYGTSTVIGSNDDKDSGTSLSLLTLTFTAGHTYHIGVGNQTSQGSVNFVLSWQQVSGDGLTGNTNTGGTGSVPNDNYENAIHLYGNGGRVSGTTSSADNYDDYAVWYNLTLGNYDKVDITIIPQGTNGKVTDFYLTDGDGTSYDDAHFRSPSHVAGSGTESDPMVVTLNISGMAGMSYTFGVIMQNPANGDFVLKWLQYTSKVTVVDATTDSPTASAEGITANLGEGMIYNPVVSEIWAMTYDVPNVIVRMHQDTGAIVGTVTYSSALKWPLLFDKQNSLVWGAGATGYTAFDATTGALVRHINAAPSDAWGISPYNGSMWTGEYIASEYLAYEGTLRQWNTATGTFTDHPAGLPQSGVYSTPVQFDFSKDGNGWFMQNANYGFQLVRFDTGSGAILGTYTVPGDNVPGNDLIQFVYDPDSNSLWLDIIDYSTSASQNQLAQFSLDSYSVVASYTVPRQNWNFGYVTLAYDPVNKAVWRASDMYGTLTGYKTADGTVFQRIDNVEDSPASVAVVPTGVWVIDSGHGDITKVTTLVPPAPQGVINDRDVWLESFKNRFETTTVQQGTAINQEQFASNGIAIASAKSLSLSASSQAFLVGDIIEPPYVVITPALRNLAGPPAYSVIAGSATLTLSGDKAQVVFDDMGSDRVTIRATVSDGGVTYHDQITLVKLVRGGTAITPLLTNEMQSVLSDTFGNVLSYIGAGGDFHLWEGAFEVTTDATFTVAANPSNCLTTIDQLGHYAVLGIPYDVNSTTVTFRAAYHGTSYDQVFYIDKIASPAGSAADPLTMTPSGRRPPVRIGVPIAGVEWNDTQATAALYSIGGAVLNDVITEYNNTANPPYKETRFWDGHRWLVMYALIDGNLLVNGTVSAEALAANTVEAFTGSFTNIVTSQITANNANLNTVIADQLAASTITAGQINTTGLTINGTNIDPNSIATGHVVDNAINVPLLTEGGSGQTIGADVDSATLTGIYPGAAVGLVTVTIQGSPGVSNAIAEVQIYLDGVKQQARAFNLNAISGASNITGNTMQVQISVPAGTHSWFVRFHRQGSNDWNLWNYSVSVLGVMK